MFTMFTKWGSVVVFIVVGGIILLNLSGGSLGISTIFTDNYLPKKYMIIEKYPFRIIMYGQFKDAENMQERFRRDEIMLNLVTKLGSLPAYKGNFDYDIDINFDSNFNTKQIRSTERAPLHRGKDGEPLRATTPQNPMRAISPELSQ